MKFLVLGKENKKREQNMKKKDRAVQLKDECNNLEALLLCQYCINF